MGSLLLFFRCTFRTVHPLIHIVACFPHQISFDAIVSGEVGDIAIDDVTFTRDNNCSFIPEFARSTYSAG